MPCPRSAGLDSGKGEHSCEETGGSTDDGPSVETDVVVFPIPESASQLPVWLAGLMAGGGLYTYILHVKKLSLPLRNSQEHQRTANMVTNSIGPKAAPLNHGQYSEGPQLMTRASSTAELGRFSGVPG